MKSDLINYNNIERSKENITNLMQEGIKNKLGLARAGADIGGIGKIMKSNVGATGFTMNGSGQDEAVFQSINENGLLMGNMKS